MLKKVSVLLVALFCLASFAVAMPKVTNEAGTKTVIKKTTIVKVKKVKHWNKHLTKGVTAEGKSK